MLEIVLFLTIVIGFLSLSLLKLPRGVVFLIISTVLSILAEKKLAVDALVEGAFGYFDTVITVLSAMFFIVAVERSGLLNHIATMMVRAFAHKPRILLLLTTLLAMSGGMITGSSSACILTTGVVALPILKAMGLDDERSGTIIAITGVLGMIAPPVNIQAMIICEGVDMPYVGFAYPLLWLTVPTALLMSLIIAGKTIRKTTVDELSNKLNHYDLVLYLPIFVLLLLSILDNLGILQIGLPLIFFLSGVSAVFNKKNKTNFFEISSQAVEQSLPILAILVGVGMLIQLMTLSGVRGVIVASMLFFPASILLLTAGSGIPLFGAISSYGAASVLGIPFLLAFRGGNDVLIASALSLLAGLGDMLPPTALASTVSAQMVGLSSYAKILKDSALFLVVITIVCILLIAYSSKIIKILANPWLFFGVIGTILMVCMLIDSITDRRE